MTAPQPPSLYQRIYAVTRTIPCGFVSSYGAIARQVGTTARTVGFAMAALPKGHDVPWQRVINSKGQISPRCDGDGNILQRILLEREGIIFDHKGRVDLQRYSWNFAAEPATDTAPEPPR